MKQERLKNRVLDDEVDYLKQLGIRWYKKLRKCQNPDCRREALCRNKAGVCMACVIREQKS